MQVKENETPESLENNTMSRQQLKKVAKDNRKKMNSDMKTLKRPLKVGEFIQYQRQQDGIFAFIHKFLKEVHGDEYENFLKREQEANSEKTKPTEQEIEKAELEESLEETK